MIDCTAIEFAGLAVEFRSEEPAALELVEQAASISPAVAPVSGVREPSLRVDLSLGSAPCFQPRGRKQAAAESPPDGLGFIPVLRAAMCQALAPDGALLHAAGASIDGAGFLLVAPSGGGKTTISRLLSQDAVLLGDETICVRPDSARPGRYAIYGTCFWSGPAYPSRAGAVPLAAVCFLRKGGFSLTPLSRPQALRELLGQLHLPVGASPEYALEFAHRLLSATPAFELSFTLDSEPASLLRAQLRKAA